MYVYTTTTKIVFLVLIEHFSLFCRLSFLYDFKGVFDMVEKKTDRRILKTKRALRESLLYLLKEQPIQKISVSRLCEKSDINRSTFYTYYSSPMDLLESIEDEILNTLEEDMIQFEKENSISQLMNSIIFYISEHKQLVRLLFDHGDPGFQNKLLLATQRWTMPMWQRRRPDYDAKALSSLHIYIVSGCMAVIRQWITSGFQESEGGSFFDVGEVVRFYFGWIFVLMIPVLLSFYFIQLQTHLILPAVFQRTY